jgi:two-component system, NtrC family, response regulator AtoC
VLHDAPIESGEQLEDPELETQLRSLARSPLTPVLLAGPPGPDRLRVAERLHRLTYPRRRAPFVDVDCAWLPAGDAGGLLFGRDPRGEKGVVENAAKGTLFLDNIADLPAADQAKLADLLDRMRFRRLGGRREITVQLRVVAAMRDDAGDLAQGGRLRSDLFSRLNVFPIRLPAAAALAG